MNNTRPLLNRLLLTMTAGNCFNVSLFEYKPLVYILSQGLVVNLICPVQHLGFSNGLSPAA